MSVFEEILENIDITKEVYKILGLPDPAKKLEVEQPLGSPGVAWLKANKMILAVVGVILLLVIVLTTTKKRKG